MLKNEIRNREMKVKEDPKREKETKSRFMNKVSEYPKVGEVTTILRTMVSRLLSCLPALFMFNPFLSFPPKSPIWFNLNLCECIFQCW